MLTFDTVTLLQYTETKFKANYIDRLYDIQNWEHNWVLSFLSKYGFEIMYDDDTFLSDATIIHVIQYAAKSGYLELVKFMFRYVYETLHDMCCKYIWQGKLNVLNWAHANNILHVEQYSQDVLDNAAIDRHIDTVIHIYKVTHFKLSTIALARIILEQNILMLDWYFANCYDDFISHPNKVEITGLIEMWLGYKIEDRCVDRLN